MYIFGYGSLINKDTRKIESSADIAVRVKGYSRDWNAKISKYNLTALGLERDGEGICNGVLVETSNDLLEELDVREKSVGYIREKIDYSKVEPLFDVKIIEAEIYTYIPLVPICASQEYPIARTYVDAVLYGCLEHGEDFLREFVATTKSWKYPILEDRGQPNYPRWKPEYVSSSVEALIRQYLTQEKF